MARNTRWVVQRVASDQLGIYPGRGYKIQGFQAKGGQTRMGYPRWWSEISGMKLDEAGLHYGLHKVRLLGFSHMFGERERERGKART